MSIEQQKAIADDVLQKLYCVDPFCIVAGGTPRDWYFDKEASDIDVFLYISPNISIEIFEKMLRNIGWDKVEALTGDCIPDNYKCNPELRCVFNVGDYEGVSVQVMLMRSSTFTSVVDKFPINICKIWYKNKRICKSREFVHAADQQVLILSNTLYSDGHKYITKVRNKFPHYNFYHSKEEYVETSLQKAYTLSEWRRTNDL